MSGLNARSPLVTARPGLCSLASGRWVGGGLITLSRIGQVSFRRRVTTWLPSPCPSRPARTQGEGVHPGPPSSCLEQAGRPPPSSRNGDYDCEAGSGGSGGQRGPLKNEHEQGGVESHTPKGPRSLGSKAVDRGACPAGSCCPSFQESPHWGAGKLGDLLSHPQKGAPWSVAQRGPP